MADLPRMTDEQWLQALRQAHAVRARLIYRIFVELRDELGEEPALDLIGRACRKMGLAKRERYLELLADDTPATFGDVFCDHSPVAAKLFELERGPDEDETTTVYLNRCVLMDGWTGLGVPADERGKLCRSAREVDHGTLEGLGLEGEFVELLSEGGRRCDLRVRRGE